VARELARRGIAVEERRVPWRRADRTQVDALTGRDRVPVLELDRDVNCDSRRIVEHLCWRESGSGLDGGVRAGVASAA
jgi:glutathione S-transferase